MQSYTEADELLTGRCKERRKIANNTWLERIEDIAIAVRLHQTDVVTYYPDGSIMLDTGGWFTMTTKERMTRFSPFSVGSNRGEWYVVHGHNFTEPVPYRDRMMWDGTRWHGIPDKDEIEAERAARKKLHRDIKKFVDSITAEEIVHAFENTGGECFVCRAGMADDHLLSHVEERYFHASLMYLAVKSRHFNNPDFIMSLIYREAQGGSVSKSFMRDTLTKFLRKQLVDGVAVAA